MRNFQRHIKKSIKLSANVTTILGRSDVGKSAIIRALYWVVFNEPTGSDFIRHGETSCYVEVHFDGRIVRRTRSKDENSYSLDGGEFKAFGREVPEAITKEFNISAISFQRQLDSPFWFGLSAGQVSQEINSLVDLNQIDRITSNINSDIRKGKTTVEYLTKKVGELEQTIEENSWVDEAWKQLVVIEDKQVTLTAGQHSLLKLSGLIDDLEEHLEKQTQAEKAIGESQQWQKKAQAVLTAQKQVKRLESLMEEYQREIRSQELQLQEQQKLQKQLENVIGKKCPLCKSDLKR